MDVDQKLIEKKVQKDLEINEFSAYDELEKVQQKWHFWHAEYSKVVKKKIDLEEKMEDVYNNIMFQLKTGKYPIEARNKAESDAIIYQDEHYRNLKKEVNEYTIICNYLKGVVKIFEQRIWVIKSLLEYEKKR